MLHTSAAQSLPVAPVAAVDQVRDEAVGVQLPLGFPFAIPAMGFLGKFLSLWEYLCSSDSKCPPGLDQFSGNSRV